jgi:hypothetical protein
VLRANRLSSRPTAFAVITMADIEDLDVSGVSSQPRVPKALVFPKRANKGTGEIASGDSFIPGAVFPLPLIDPELSSLSSRN